MTYNVFGGTLNLIAQSITQSRILSLLTVIVFIVPYKRTSLLTCLAYVID